MGGGQVKHPVSQVHVAVLVDQGQRLAARLGHAGHQDRVGESGEVAAVLLAGGDRRGPKGGAGGPQRRGVVLIADPRFALDFATEAPNRLDTALVRNQVNDVLKDLVGRSLYSGNVDPDTLQSIVFKAIAVVIERNAYPLTDSERAELVQEIVDDILGNGPLEQLLRDSEVTEVMVVRWNQIYVERHGRLSSTGLSFSDENHLRTTIDRIVGKVGRRIDESSPLVDARLRDGSRVNAVVPPIALDGANLTIRKFFKEPFTVKDMLATGTITESALRLLEASVKGRMNIVISGGTGSGKTTTLVEAMRRMEGDVGVAMFNANAAAHFQECLKHERILSNEGRLAKASRVALISPSSSKCAKASSPIATICARRRRIPWCRANVASAYANGSRPIRSGSWTLKKKKRKK